MSAYEQYLMFDSTDDDVREYSAAQFADFFAQQTVNGVITRDNGLEVYAQGDEQAVRVRPGYAWINGYMYSLRLETDGDEDMRLPLESAHPTYPRIDIIVLRLDTAVSERSIKLRVITGVPAAEPVAPDITRSGSVYELCLAQVLVASNTAVIADSAITDTRRTDLCGIAGSVLQVAEHIQPADTISAGMLRGSTQANADAVAQLGQAQLRNIIISQNAPTAGVHNGDLWLSYSV